MSVTASSWVHPSYGEISRTAAVISLSSLPLEQPNEDLPITQSDSAWVSRSLRETQAESEIGRRISNVIGALCFVSRFGGDEFVVILPDTDSDAAQKLAVLIVEKVSVSACVLVSDLYWLSADELVRLNGYGSIWGIEHAFGTLGLSAGASRALSAMRLRVSNDLSAKTVVVSADASGDFLSSRAHH